MSKGALGLLSAYWPEHTPRYAHVPLERVTAVCIHRQAATAGDRPALVARDGSLTYAGASDGARAAAAALRERAGPGGRVAVLVEDPARLVVCALGCLEADLLAWLGGPGADRGSLRAFSPDLVVADAPVDGMPTVRPEELLGAEPQAAPGRPDLRSPVLALSRPGGGEVLHNHKTLAATAIAFGSFFMLEAGAELVLLEPPTGWLGLSAALGAWRHGATVHAGWEAGARLPARADYLVMRWETAADRYLGDAPSPAGVHAGAGAMVGVEGPFGVAERRRLARRLGTPVLTVVGRNDLGPVLASHPVWFLEGAAGIPLPNVDLRPLNPADGRPLSIGWDAVEEAEAGVKSSLAPAGGELAEGWLRTRLLARVDPTGLYFLSRGARRA